jgi:hypothetical protein
MRSAFQSREVGVNGTKSNACAVGRRRWRERNLDLDTVPLANEPTYKSLGLDGIQRAFGAGRVDARSVR